LHHEVRDDAVEDGAVVEALVHVGQEIGDGARGLGVIELDAQVALAGGHLHVLGHAHFSRVAFLMMTGLTGTFSYAPLVAVSTILILSTTSMPDTTLPNTA